MCPKKDKSRPIKTSKDSDKTDGNANFLQPVVRRGQSVVRHGKAWVEKKFNPDFEEDDSSKQKLYQNPPFDIEDTDPEKLRETIANTDHQTTDEQRIAVELCLIVPAWLVSNLTPPQTLTREKICDLIDNCAYFRCLPSRDLDSLEQDLQPTSEPILPDSERDVYIRLQIEDGENMIDNSSCYGLKKRLPQTGTGKLQKRLLLANLSGRQHFNCI